MMKQFKGQRTRRDHTRRSPVFEALEQRQLLAFDFGDAPSPYPVLLADDGARHTDSLISRQLGNALPVPGNYDDSRRIAVSADGQLVAVGHPIFAGEATDAGRTQVFRWNGNAWLQQGQDIHGEAAQDLSGHAVALSGDGQTVAVSATRRLSGSDGQVRFFRWDGSTWQQLGSSLNGEATSDFFGWSVALSSDGNTAVIGARGANGVSVPGDTGYNAGRTYIYQWDGSTWLQRGSPIPGESNRDDSGESVAVSADGLTVAIGAADAKNSEGVRIGHTRIFTWDGADWVQRGGDIDGAFQGFGERVSLNAAGDLVAIGSPNNGLGVVHIYHWSGTAWQPQGSPLVGADIGNWMDDFGDEISLSSDGSRLAIGATRAANGEGFAALYNWNGTNWSQAKSWRGPQSGVGLGYGGVSLNADGTTLAIGAGGNVGTRVFQVNSLQLGASKDTEENGAPSVAADGDGDDEDGIIFGDWQAGASATLEVTVSGGNALLDAWIDFNQDGDWLDAGEQVFASQIVNNGNNQLTLDVPTSAASSTYARFRLSSSGGLTPTGLANDGEVEDYLLTINALPTLTPIEDRTLAEDAVQQTISLDGISAGSDENQPLRLQATSDNPQLIPHPTVDYTSPDTTGTLFFTPLADQYGTATITITVEDGGLDGNLNTPEDNATLVRTFEATVTPVNDHPVLDALADLTIAEDAGAQTVDLTGIRDIDDFLPPQDAVQWRVEDGGNGHWYRLITATPLTWTQAAARAQELGGYLATITSQEEQNFIAALTAPHSKTFLGGYQDLTATDYAEPGGGWKWVTGEPWEFEAWNSSNPSNSGGEDVLEILGNAWAPNQLTWNDIGGNTSSPFLVEIEPSPLRVTATSSDISLIATPQVTYVSPNSTGSLTFAPLADAHGTATITVTVEDPGFDQDFATTEDNGVSSQTFEVTVTAVNDVPTLIPYLPQENLVFDFESGTQGWSAYSGNIFGTLPFGGYMRWVTGGNPGRMINARDTVSRGGGLYLSAPPAEVSGDLSQYATLRFDERLPSGSCCSVRVVLVSGDTAFQAPGGRFSPINTWSTRELPLDSAHWVRIAGAKSFEDSLQTIDRVLFNVDVLSYLNAFEAGIDNVTLVPKVVPLDDLYLMENAGAQTVALTDISAGGQESQPLRVTASSSQPSLIPDPVVNYASPNATGSLVLTPVANRHGTAVITVTVEDGGLDGNLATPEDNATFSHEFNVWVNATPTLNPIPRHPLLGPGAGLQSVVLTGITAGGNEDQLLRVTASSSDESIIASPSVEYTSAETTATLHFTPTGASLGQTVLTVTVTDAGFDGSFETTADNAVFERQVVVNVNATPWQNPRYLNGIRQVWDVDDNDAIELLDVLTIVNLVNQFPAYDTNGLPTVPADLNQDGLVDALTERGLFPDVNGDARTSLADALAVVNKIHQLGASQQAAGEGENDSLSNLVVTPADQANTGDSRMAFAPLQATSWPLVDPEEIDPRMDRTPATAVADGPSRRHRVSNHRRYPARRDASIHRQHVDLTQRDHDEHAVDLLFRSLTEDDLLSFRNAPSAIP